MIIEGFQKTSFLDFPNKMTSIIFTGGCNMNCLYCHNKDLIPIRKKSTLNSEDILQATKERLNVINAVVISGGEPTIQEDLIPFLIKLKTLKLDIKLDTNGTNPFILETAIMRELVDYIALDIKQIEEKYKKITQSNVNFEKIKETLDLLVDCNFPSEIRITVSKSTHTFEDVDNIVRFIRENGFSGKIYIQKFRNGDTVNDQTLKEFSDSEMNDLMYSFINDEKISKR